MIGRISRILLVSFLGLAVWPTTSSAQDVTIDVTRPTLDDQNETTSTYQAGQPVNVEGVVQGVNMPANYHVHIDITDGGNNIYNSGIIDVNNYGGFSTSFTAPSPGPGQTKGYPVTITLHNDDTNSDFGTFTFILWVYQSAPPP